MYNYPYKEKDYAEVLLKKGFTSNHINHELKILGKYYKSIGKDKDEIKELIESFCKKYLKKYNRVTHFKMLNTVLTYVDKEENVLVQIDSVNITSNEVTYISSLDINYMHKKLLFTLLVLDKLNKRYNEIRKGVVDSEHYFGGGAKYRELSSTSHVKFKRSQNIHIIIGELAKMGLLEIKNKGFVKLSFIYEIEESNDAEIIVEDFQSVGLYYDLHTEQDKVKRCECCKVPIKVKSNRSKYCEKCSVEISNEKNKEYARKSMKKARNKNVKGLESS